MSTTDFRYFPYLIQDIVSQVRAVYDTVDGLKPYYEFGTYLELTKRVDINNSIGVEKYPLIWLVWEANESIQNWYSDVAYNISPRLFVCNLTKTEYSSIQRYDINFVGVLFPILEIFKKYLRVNPYMSVNGEMKYQLAEHLLWGESLGFQKNKNVLFDTLDAIELKYNEFEVHKIC